MHKWITLVKRYGETIPHPTLEQLKEALTELFASTDEEHPDAWIDCGSDDGPLYNISVYGSGYAIYTQYSDVDLTEELESKKIQNLDKESALELWLKLIEGKLNEI